MKNKVNEWQELILKKDIEKILKLISKNQSVHNAIIFDLVIAVVAILIDKLLTPEAEGRTWLFVILALLCVIPFTVIAFKRVYNLLLKKNTSYKVFSITDLISTFDNDICYFAMMADSYNQMLNDAISHKDNNNVILFYYIETWYYINKAKLKMSAMQYKTNQIFTNCPDLIISKNLISVTRIVNLVMILEDIRESTNKLILNNELKLNDSSIILINKKYDEKYKPFVEEINKNFNQLLKNINFYDDNRFPKIDN